MDITFRKIFIISLLLCILVGLASLCGFTFPETIYAQETINWRVQSVGQDFVNLAIVLPVLAAAVILMKKKQSAGYSIAAGVLAYLTYTYIIYCFDIHFNVLFILYCAILGLCTFSLFTLYRSTVIEKKSQTGHSWLNNVIGVYFIGLSALFFFLWLSEIVPAQLQQVTPASLKEAGLPTNPVHILDLSIVLPFIFITGVRLLMKKENGKLSVPATLTFFALMQSTIGTLNLIMSHNGINVKAAVAAFMYGMSVVSLLLLMVYFKFNTKNAAG